MLFMYQIVSTFQFHLFGGHFCHHQSGRKRPSGWTFLSREGLDTFSSSQGYGIRLAD
jgi:hypothetical protein